MPSQVKAVRSLPARRRTDYLAGGCRPLHPPLFEKLFPPWWSAVASVVVKQGREIVTLFYTLRDRVRQISSGGRLEVLEGKESTG